jgi:DNA-directed RNA polymerase subunit RPC12/RpoP
MKIRCDYCGSHARLSWHAKLKVHYCPKCRAEMENALRRADWIRSLGRRR